MRAGRRTGHRFHHAAARSYERLLDHVTPVELLGLTATPERADGLSLLHRFDGRIAAELRLWDAIDQHRLSPFAYFGIHDGLDLREVPWRRGRGYDIEGLTNLYTASDAWARQVVKEVAERADDLTTMRALGFCVSIDHARFMARVFNDAGIASVAVWGDSPADERQAALRDLADGRVKVVFSVDLFNEGVDVPVVDTLLLLRPTDSPVLFLQQLGRGLRRAPGKSVCTVLDFVGHHRKEFRFDGRWSSSTQGDRHTAATRLATTLAAKLNMPCGMTNQRGENVRLDLIDASSPVGRPTDLAAKMAAGIVKQTPSAMRPVVSRRALQESNQTPGCAPITLR